MLFEAGRALFMKNPDISKESIHYRFSPFPFPLLTIFSLFSQTESLFTG